jgi:hypothetical protein
MKTYGIQHIVNEYLDYICTCYLVPGGQVMEDRWTPT